MLRIPESPTDFAGSCSLFPFRLYWFLSDIARESDGNFRDRDFWHTGSLHELCFSDRIRLKFGNHPISVETLAEGF
jgi:hypothetical protein